MDIRSEYNKILDQININKEYALERLIDLYCLAVDSYEHDIVDSIPMYILDFGDKDTYNYLDKYLKSIKDEYLKNEFQIWMKEISAKHGL